MKRALVTGGRGVIGRHAATALAAKGFDVHVTSYGSGSHGEHVTTHRVDLLDAEQTRAVVDFVRPTHLLHLAWCTTPPDYWESDDNDRWLESSRVLLEAATTRGVERAVVASTGAVYPSTAGIWREDAPPAPIPTRYGRSKRRLEEMAHGVAVDACSSWASGRVFNVFGPGEHRTRLVAAVIGALLRGEPVETTSGHQVRDYLSSVDIGHAFAHLLEGEESGAVNIGSGEPIAVRDLVTTIADLVGRPDLLRLGARDAPEEPALFVPDVGRLAATGWSPARSLADRLRETVDCWSAR